MCERGEPWKSYWYYIWMILIGRYDSPYVSSLHALAIPFELLPLSPFSQASQLRQFSPIGRMPALILMSGEVLIESAAILDYLDDIVGPSRALLPVAGEPRRRCLRILASATAACDKAIAISYERRRPSERIFVDWIARCWTQLDAVLAELDSFKRSSWPVHDRLMQTDITTACMLGYVRRVEPGARTAATPTSKNWQRDAKSIRLSRPVLRLP
jgi:glutathione S-transferase